MLGADVSAGVPALVIALFSVTGLVGGVVALLKVRPESGRLVVEAAEGAVVVQSTVISALRAELSELRGELEATRDELVAEAKARREAEGARRRLERELDATRGELERHAQQLENCATRIDELSRRLEAHGVNGEQH